MGIIHVALTKEALQPGDFYDLVKDDTRGGLVVFLGDVRRITDGIETEYIEYEAYEEMALKTMREIATDAASEFSANVAIVHRLGRVMPGETSVICVAACPHRADAFACCRRLIDGLKKEVPIWKKEVGPDGAEWRS